MDDHTGFPTAHAICEGSKVRAARAASSRTDEERSEALEARAPRQGRGTTLRTIEDAVQRLGITGPVVLRKLHLILDGVAKLHVPPNRKFVDAAWRRAAMRRSWVPHTRSEAPMAQDVLIPLGRRWGMDITCRMPLSVDGKRYGIFFVEKHTLYVIVFYLADKTTSSFVYALRELVIFVRVNFPEALPIELHGDSDRAWTITGRGDDMLPKELAEYMANE